MNVGKQNSGNRMSAHALSSRNAAGAGFRLDLDAGGRATMHTLAPLTIVAFLMAALGVWIFVRDVRTYRTRRAAAATDLEREIRRLERWKYGSVAAAILIGIIAAEATMQDAPSGVTVPLYVLIALSVAVGLVASIISGWKQGRG